MAIVNPHPADHGMREIKIGDQRERYDTIVELLADRASHHATMLAGLECLYASVGESVLADMISRALAKHGIESEQLVNAIVDTLMADGATNVLAVALWGDVGHILSDEMRHRPQPTSIEALRPRGER